MKELQVLNTNNKTIDSREVAEMLGKEHKQLMREIRDISKILESENFSPSKYFIESNYLSEQNKNIQCYLITKMGCEMLGNKLQGLKGIVFTAKYIERFNEMEKRIQETQPQLPTTYKDALIALVAEIEEKERIEAEKNRLIHNNKVYTVSEIAKELGFKSAQELNNDLKERKIQYKVNNTWVLCARYAELGYTNSKQTELDNGKIVYTTRWTGKGRDWLINEVYI